MIPHWTEKCCLAFKPHCQNDWGGETERETERETEKETERETEIETERETDLKKYGLQPIPK